EPGNQHVMLLVIGRARDTGHDSKYSAKSIVNAIDGIGHPAAAAPVPTFAFQNRVEHGFWIRRRRHCLQGASMRLLLECAGSQEFPHIRFVGECTIALLAEFPLVLFLSCFHLADGNVCAERASEPALQSSPSGIRQMGRSEE